MAQWQSTCKTIVGALVQTPRSHVRPDGCGSPPVIQCLGDGGGELVSRRSCLAD